MSTLLCSNLIFRRGLRSRYKNRVRTDAQKSTIQECRNTLSRSIIDFRTTQTAYMPGISILLESGDMPINQAEDTDQDQIPEITPLILPSALTPAQSVTACIPGLAHKELRLRHAQANDALCDLRRLRRMFVGMIDRHKRDTMGTGTKVNTRVNTILRGFKARIMRAAERYRDARRALESLDPAEATFAWRLPFQVLTDEDIRGPGKEDEDLLLKMTLIEKKRKAKNSEGRYKPSWIWMSLSPTRPSNPSASAEGSEEDCVEDTPMSADEVQDCMRVEWTRAVARAERYEEEARLLVDEMERTLVFFTWQANDWRRRRNGRTPSDISTTDRLHPNDDILRGIHAYAERQAALRESMIARFVRRWTPVLQTNQLGLAWLSVYKPARVPSATTLDHRDSGDHEPEEPDSDFDSEGEHQEKSREDGLMKVTGSSEYCPQDLEDALADGGDL